MQVHSVIIAILQDMTQEWDMEFSEIHSETKLMEDLGFVSVDIIHLVVSIEEHFKQKLGFNALLMQNGRYVDDLSIEEIANFVSSQFTGAK